MSLVTSSSLVILEILSTMDSLSISLNFAVFVSVIEDIILVSSRNYKYCVKTNLHLVRGGGGIDGWVTREISSTGNWPSQHHLEVAALIS
jgi:hypothetical protein